MAVSRVLTGTVASIDAATGRPLVTVARRFGIGRTLGPCPIVAGPWAVGAATEAPSSANTGAASATTARPPAKP